MTEKRPSSRIPTPRLLPLTILTMAGLLVLKSGDLVYAATGSSTTTAEAATGSSTTTAEAATKAETPAKPAPAATTPAAPAPTAVQLEPARPEVSDSERALLTDLRQRRLALDAREATLAAREATLAAVEHRLAGRVEELTGLQTRLEALEQQRKEHDESNWRGLVKLYEVMKPRDAATIFNDLELPVLLPVLDRMKEAKAALILSAMLPERARQVTAELAQMRAKANTVAAPAPPTPPARPGVSG